MKWVKILLILILIYTLFAYLAAPSLWRHYGRHQELEANPKYTLSVEGIKSDPLNIGLAATPDELLGAFKAAGWVPADPSSFRTDLKLAASVILRKTYPTAPMSKLFLYGRYQDMAFEKEVGGTPSKRHHVRLWQSNLIENKRPLWIGSATFDESVGFNRNTGAFTHHIDPDIDRERDELISDLKNAGQIVEIFQVTGIGPTLNARNGSRDYYYTDGEMTIGILATSNIKTDHANIVLSQPHIHLKNEIFKALRIFFFKPKDTDGLNKHTEFHSKE